MVFPRRKLTRLRRAGILHDARDRCFAVRRVPARKEKRGKWNTWSFGLAIASLAISLITAIGVFLLLNKIRKESRKSFEVASRIQEDWDKFSSHEATERERLAERVGRFENDTGDRVERFEKVATGTRASA